MNLWARKSGLILLSALTLFSCEEELSTVGLPPENDLGIFFVDVPLGDKVSQVWVDNVNSRSTGTVLVGSYTDPYFGNIEARNFSEVNLPKNNPGEDVDGSAVFDSLVLVTRIRGIYGNQVAAGTQRIEIYQLTDTIPLVDATYTTASSQETGQLLSASEFMLHPDSLGLKWEDTGRKLETKEDTLYKARYFDSNNEYIYRSNFKIDEAYASEFFNLLKAKAKEFSSSKDFAAHLKGISFAPTTGNSAIITYGGADTRLVLYYTETDGSGNKSQETISFPLNTIRSYNQITPNAKSGWNGSDLDDITTFYEPYTIGTDLAYLQNGTNLLLRLDMSGFNEFSDTVENAIVQKAELVFENLKGISKTTPPPSTMVYYMTSLDSLANKNYRVGTLINNNRSPLVIGYDKDNKKFSNDITISLQNLLKEDTFNQLIMAPVTINTSNGSISANGSGVNRFVVSKNDIRIRFYYTVPNLNN
ncbi:hypothetical protein C900_04467 [Fulvivirga imtechensis AK7]|uniref:DUF4270 domain-containing protein n=1 Tax=Fulvivirga imtechensis AK7 TaxID=1237149 RepID=L8JR18_9BACT|nr:DUF4270 family protein [Fulvivirga imtechensis]ELR69944.1 hypothetical protein C900_04467 [Fulvivirga imtechensis AK7]